MSKLAVAFVALIVAALQIGAAAAAIPSDFTGTWTLVSDAPTSGAARSMTVRMVVTRTTMRGDPVSPYVSGISITRIAQDGPITDNYSIGTIGGVVIDSPHASSRRSVTWSGSTLVFASSSDNPRDSDWSDRRESWSVDAQGRLQIEIETRGARRNYPDVRLVYERQR